MHNLDEQLLTQIEQLHKLIQLLDNELQLISTREAEPLMALLKAKEVLLDDIHQRDRQIQTMYLSAKENDALTEAMTDKVETCFALVEQCKYRTDINEKAVANGQLRLAHLRHVLVELRAKESMTYDRSGKAQSSANTRSIKA